MPASTGTQANMCTNHLGVMVAICGTVLVTSARFLAPTSPSAWDWALPATMRNAPRNVDGWAASAAGILQTLTAAPSPRGGRYRLDTASIRQPLRVCLLYTSD